MSVSTLFTTALALVCFAANSLLCRKALAQGAIDAASFTALRLVSGAVVLGGLASMRRGKVARAGSWGSALALVVYAAPFSFAYLRLPAGVGALLLFGAVQLTMIGGGLLRGERPRPAMWFGLVVAFTGLIGLAAPGVSAPEPWAAAAMACAGMGWGVYSLRGRVAGGGDPVVATAGNFLRSVPIALPVLAATLPVAPLHASPSGIALAVASGALASGLGYSVWYAALEHLTATRAAVVQLLVPVLAAVGGVVILGEAPSVRLVLAGTAILSGVGLAMQARTRSA